METGGTEPQILLQSVLLKRGRKPFAQSCSKFLDYTVAILRLMKE
jgi:hypothetical protein